MKGSAGGGEGFEGWRVGVECWIGKGGGGGGGKRGGCANDSCFFFFFPFLLFFLPVFPSIGLKALGEGGGRGFVVRIGGRGGGGGG